MPAHWAFQFRLHCNPPATFTDVRKTRTAFALLPSATTTMGLWDYEEAVEAYVPGQASSSDSPSEAEDSPTPRTKRGRKRKNVPAAAAARPVVAIDVDEDNEELVGFLLV
jgi:hypothetical protein